MADPTPTTAAGWTRNAIQEINSGELADARQMLAAALRLDADYETAWIWFGSIATDDAERRYCYERAVAIDPASVVAPQLAQIKTTESRPPVELQDLEAPPLPEEFGGTHLEQEPSRRAWRPLALAAALVLGVLLAGIWFLWPRSNTGGSPIYVAFVAGLTGSGADSALQMEQALQVYIDFVNNQGGVDGRPVRVVSFDDQDDANLAVEVANQIVSDGRFSAVIGHRFSTTAMAAAPIYQAAGIPMIAPSATADGLTNDCDWCYRTVFDNSTQGRLMASYIKGVLGVDRVVIIAEESSYGDSLANSFLSVFGEAGGSVAAQYSLPADPTAAGDTIQQTADAIASDHRDTMVVIAAGANLAQPVLIALRSAGATGKIFGSDAMGSTVFLEQANAAAAAQGMGVVTDGIYASAPLFVDSLNGDAVRLTAKFEQEFGDMPTWRSFTTADAGVAIVQGLASQGSKIRGMSIVEQREAIRTFWTTLTSPESSIPGFVGPIYFDKTRTAQRPVAIGIASGNFFDSAPRQIEPLTKALSNGDEVDKLITVGDSKFVVKRVVQSGVDFNLIRDLNTVAETFYADFFVWFKYYGDDDAVDVVFTNIADPQTLTIDKVRSSDTDGLKYAVFRVTGTFTSPLNFRSFPFDTQVLQVHFANRTLTSSQLIYAIDSDFMEISAPDRLSSGGNATTSINQISNWNAIDLEAFAGSVGTSSNLGDPGVSSANQGIEFSQVGVAIEISRNVGQFLLKNLLPLVLLLAITYISLFFSHEQTTERVSFGITGVLTGAVLLSTVVSVLPDVGYTVAIEWAFYGFILLSALCILVALIGGRLNNAKQITEMRTLDWIARIGYPVLVGAVVLGYWLVYR